MATGPSPVIPFLLVVTLGLAIYGGSLTNNVSPLSNIEQATLDLLLVIPLLVLLLVYIFGESIIVPLTIVLVTYTVSKMLLSPLVLVLIIYFVSIFLPFFELYYIKRGDYHEREMMEYEGRSILLLVVFLFLSSLLCHGDGNNKLGIVVVVVVLYFLYDLSQYSSY